MQMRTIWRRAARWLTLVAACGPMWLGGTAAAQIFETKVNWDVGEARVFGDQTFQLMYGDYHVKFATPGQFVNDDDRTTANGGFDGAVVNETVNDPGDDCLTIDWDEVGAGTITGKNHVGATFHIQNTGGAGVRTVESYLTNVTMTGPGGGMVGPFPTMDTPGGTPTYRRVNSAAVTFVVADPGIVGPVTFSGVSFYKTLVEPPLESLDAVDFPALPKTFLGSEPDFMLGFGDTHEVIVMGVDPPEWLISVYTTTWENPVLSAAVGAPTTISVDTWYAEQLVPEPASVVLLVLGGLAVYGATRGRRIIR
ncbi:MAG: PEP-CTERM sorting domain-containing protein [Planctomycetes bacterium]|nr:PEP-CTERM sorting domain-containing protein [Planctomycetota bacterium]